MVPTVLFSPTVSVEELEKARNVERRKKIVWTIRIHTNAIAARKPGAGWRHIGGCWFSVLL
jgi:hypothetical protein